MKQVLLINNSYIILLFVAPSSPPNSVTLTAIDSVTLNISWSLPSPDNINGVIRYYIINISVVDTLEHLQYTSADTNISVDSLHPYYTYTVYVAIVTIGIGPFSTGQSITTPEDGIIINIITLITVIVIF